MNRLQLEQQRQKIIRELRNVDSEDEEQDLREQLRRIERQLREKKK